MNSRVRGVSAGFTLIELLVSSVLTAVLSVGLLTVLQASFRDAREAEQLRRSVPSTQLLRELLRRDLRHAEGFVRRADGVVLAGFLATSPNTGEPTLQRAVVVYQVQPWGEAGRLVREELATARVGGGLRRVETVWVGIRQFVLRADAPAEGELPLRWERSGPAAAPLMLQRMPPQVRVVLTGATGQRMVEETVFHHQEL
jgi:prepilin-type N-terminal cleavage/methylation domain-containing protein